MGGVGWGGRLAREASRKRRSDRARLLILCFLVIGAEARDVRPVRYWPAVLPYADRQVVDLYTLMNMDDCVCACIWANKAVVGTAGLCTSLWGYRHCRIPQCNLNFQFCCCCCWKHRSWLGFVVVYDSYFLCFWSVCLPPSNNSVSSFFLLVGSLADFPLFLVLRQPFQSLC